jgi:hypothetical protein
MLPLVQPIRRKNLSETSGGPLSMLSFDSLAAASARPASPTSSSVDSSGMAQSHPPPAAKLSESPAHGDGKINVIPMPTAHEDRASNAPAAAVSAQENTQLLGRRAEAEPTAPVTTPVRETSAGAASGTNGQVTTADQNSGEQASTSFAEASLLSASGRPGTPPPSGDMSASTIRRRERRALSSSLIKFPRHPFAEGVVPTKPRSPEGVKSPTQGRSRRLSSSAMVSPTNSQARHSDSPDNSFSASAMTHKYAATPKDESVVTAPVLRVRVTCLCGVTEQLAVKLGGANCFASVAWRNMTFRTAAAQDAKNPTWTENFEVNIGPDVLGIGAVPPLFISFGAQGASSDDGWAAFRLEQLFDSARHLTIPRGLWHTASVALHGYEGTFVDVAVLPLLEAASETTVVVADEILGRDLLIRSWSTMWKLIECESAALAQTRREFEAAFRIAIFGYPRWNMEMDEARCRDKLQQEAHAVIELIATECIGAIGAMSIAHSGILMAQLLRDIHLTMPGARERIGVVEAGHRRQMLAEGDQERARLSTTEKRTAILSDEESRRAVAGQQEETTFRLIALQFQEHHRRDALLRVSYQVSRLALEQDRSTSRQLAEQAALQRQYLQRRNHIEGDEMLLFVDIHCAEALEAIEAAATETRRRVTENATAARADIWLDYKRSQHPRFVEQHESAVRTEIVEWWHRKWSRALMALHDAINIAKENRASPIRSGASSPSPNSPVSVSSMMASHSPARDRSRLENHEVRARRDISAAEMSEAGKLQVLATEASERVYLYKRATVAHLDLMAEERDRAVDIELCQGHHAGTRHLHRKLLKLQRESNRESRRALVREETAARSAFDDNVECWRRSLEEKFDTSYAAAVAKEHRQQHLAEERRAKAERALKPLWYSAVEDEFDLATKKPISHIAHDRRAHNDATHALDAVKDELATVSPRYGAHYVPSRSALDPLPSRAASSLGGRKDVSPSAGSHNARAGTSMSSRSARLLARNGSAPSPRQRKEQLAAASLPSIEKAAARSTSGEFKAAGATPPSSSRPETPRVLPPLARAVKRAVDTDGPATLETPAMNPMIRRLGEVTPEFTRTFHANLVTINALHVEMGRLEGTGLSTSTRLRGPLPPLAGPRPQTAATRGGPVSDLESNLAIRDKLVAASLAVQRWMRWQVAWQRFEYETARRIQRAWRQQQRLVHYRRRGVALTQLHRRFLAGARAAAFARWRAFVQSKRPQSAAVDTRKPHDLAVTLAARNASLVLRRYTIKWATYGYTRSRVVTMARSNLRTVLRRAYMSWLSFASKRCTRYTHRSAARAELYWMETGAKRILLSRWSTWLHIYLASMSRRLQAIDSST